MRWVACFLWFLTLAAGCVLEDKQVEAGMCGLCPLDQPVCTEDLQCVQCTADQDDYCKDRSLICDIESSTCVDCLGDSDCTAADAARCVSNECTRCNDNAQCADIDDLPENANVCDDGLCVDCTPETEADTCPNDKSCNPRTRECTDTTVGSRETCETCVADSECGADGGSSEEHRCVEMFCPAVLFCPADNRFPNSETGFCLKVFSPGECEQPYAIRIPDRRSLSGDPLQSYCGINETLATCPAVRALHRNESCPCPESGICRNVGGLSLKCTYYCEIEGVNAVECLPDNPTGRPGTNCGVGSGGSGGDPYCGG